MVANNNKVGEASSSAILILCLFLWLCVSVSVEVEEQQQKVVEEQRKKPWVSEWERLREAYGIYTKVWSASSWQWQMLKKIATEAYYRWFPPNLDFRKHDETKGERGGGEGGASEKVKEALAKSVGKSKATVEDSARSAAKIAGETVHKTTQKVKKTFSDGQTHPQNEL